MKHYLLNPKRIFDVDANLILNSWIFGKHSLILTPKFSILLSFNLRHLFFMLMNRKENFSCDYFANSSESFCIEFKFPETSKGFNSKPLSSIFSQLYC